MKHFDIYLRKKVTETDLYLQELAQRKELSGRDQLVLFSREAFTGLTRFRALGEAVPLTLGAMEGRALEDLILERIE